MRVTFRIPLLWTLLLAFFFACMLAGVVAWFILLSTICTNPRTPVLETMHVIPYNCHGMTVFISHFEDAMLLWLVPVEGLFIFLSMVAAAMVIRAAASVQPIDVQSQLLGASSPPRIRIIAVPPGEAPQWVREKWVGLELPLAQWSTSPSRRLIAGVRSGPRGFFAGLVALLGGELQHRSGFKVSVLKAVAVLETASPEAAQWWRTNAPHLMTPSRCFLFSEEVCKVVQ